MSLTLVGSAINSLLVDLLNQRRHGATSYDIAAAWRTLAGAGGQSATNSASAAPSSPSAGQGGDFYQSAMKADLSMIMVAVPSNPAGYGGSTNTSSSFLNDLKLLLSSAMSGDAGGAERAAAAVQADIKNAGAVPAAVTPAVVAGNSQTNFAANLDKVIAAAQSSNTTPPAAGDPAKSVQSPSGGRHHRHRTSVQSTSSAQGSANATADSSATDGLGAGGPLVAVNQAYELLMGLGSATAE